MKAKGRIYKGKRWAAGILAATMIINGLFTGGFAGEQNAEAATTASLTVDLTDTTGDIMHGAAGFLYGVSNEDVPTTNTMTPLKPKVLCTKGALGTEHPYGDALDVAKTFLESGGEQVMMYNSNYYGVFGVTANYRDYAEVLKNIIAPAVVEWKEDWDFEHANDNLSDIDINQALIYIPINEGTPINGTNTNVAWETYYDAIKEADPDAVIAGPNSYEYNKAFSSGIDMASHIQYCADNDCMPDIITWHDLQVDKLQALQVEMDDFRDIWNNRTDWTQYKKDHPEKFEDGGDVPEIPQICINEYADFADCGVPGRLVNWIARLEDQKVYGCLPFWHQANNLNDLTADANEGNGAWWLYKWYGDMSGQTVKVSTNTSYDKLYGVASVDDTKKIATTLFGGVDGTANINLLHVNKTGAFKDADKVHVKVQSTAFSGYHGAKQETPVVYEGTFPVNSDGSVTLSVKNMKFSTAYNVTITEAAKGETLLDPVTGQYQKVYEAEEASQKNCRIKVEGDYNPRYYLSAGQAVEMTQDAELTYTIEVPVDGKYQLDFIYGNGTGSSRNDAKNHRPLNLLQEYTIDDMPVMDVIMENTLLDSMTGIKTLYADLTAGKHTIKIVTAEQGRVLQDSLTVTWNGAIHQPVKAFSNRYEAEQADFNLLLGKATTVRTESSISDYSGNGYVTGLEARTVTAGGGIRWNVVTRESGLYNVTFRYLSNNTGTLQVYQGNTATTLDGLVDTLACENTSGAWKTITTTLYFQKGINIIDVDTIGKMVLDYMQVDEVADTVKEQYTDVIEAEDCIPFNSGIQTGESRGASGGEYVVGMEGDVNAESDADKYLEFTYDAPAAGTYRMQIFQSNNDICGEHSYNTKIIDKYVSVKVNNREAERYFFINTFSDDTFREKTITVKLNKGANTIKLYNDDSWQVKWGGTTATPGENELDNYAPNFDKFMFTPLTLDSPAAAEGEYGISLSATAGGYATVDKNRASKGGEFNVSIFPEKGIQKVLLNGVDVTKKVQYIQEGEYSLYVGNVGEDAFVKIYFNEGNGEYIDAYIRNAGFGSGSSEGWNASGVMVAKSTDYSYEGYYACVTPGNILSQTIAELPAGHYTLSVYTKGKSVKKSPSLYIQGENMEKLSKTVSVTGDYTQNTIAFELKEKGKNVTVGIDISAMTAGTLYADNFSLTALEARDAGQIAKDMDYFVDCGDHNPDTLSSGVQFGRRNHVTDQIFGEDIRTGYKWGLVTSDTDPVIDSPDLASNAVFTEYQRANTNSGAVMDLQPATTSFRYAHNQLESGFSPRYVRYRFQAEEGTYKVVVGMGNIWGNSGNPDVYAGTGNSASDTKLNTAALNISTGQNKEVSATVKVAANQEYLEVYALSEEATINMNYIKIAKERAAVTGIEVTAPSQTTYEYGEKLNTAGMVIKVNYGDGSSEDIYPALTAITGYNRTKPGTQEITVSYTYNGVTVTDTVEVTVKEKPVLTALEMTPPAKTVYAYGEKLVTDGMIIKVVYSNNTKKELDAEDCSFIGYDAKKTGQQTITVRYTENGITVEKTFTVTVNAAITPTTPVTPSASTKPVQNPAKAPVKGKIYTAGRYRYQVTKTATGTKKGEVAVAALKTKSLKKITISSEVKINGYKFKVTSIKKNAFKNNKKITSVVIGKNIRTIGKNAFTNCKILKNININTTLLKKVTKGTFKGIHSKAVIKVPKKKLKAYKKMLPGLKVTAK